MHLPTLDAQHVHCVGTVWEQVHRQKGWGQYPPENLIRWVARTYPDKNQRRACHILDLGCGGGASTWFLAEEGFQASGLDFSEAALAAARQYLARKGLEATWHVGSMSQLPFEDDSLDAVIDMGSSGSFAIDTIRGILDEVYRILKPGGRFYGFWIGKRSTIAGQVHPADPSLYMQITNGPLQQAPTLRVFEEAECRELLSRFQWVSLESTLRSEANQTQWVERLWVNVRKLQ